MRHLFLAGAMSLALALSGCAGSNWFGSGEISEEQRTFNTLVSACNAGSGALRTTSLHLSSQGIDPADVEVIDDTAIVISSVCGGPAPIGPDVVSQALIAVQAEIYKLTIIGDNANKDSAAQIDPVTIIVTATELAKWLLDMRAQAQAGDMTVEQKQGAWVNVTANWNAAVNLWETAKLRQTLEAVAPNEPVEVIEEIDDGVDETIIEGVGG